LTRSISFATWASRPINIELPQIIVIGDQSSGKSSVLEAISRIKFPAKSGLGTRITTKLVLRNSASPKVDVSIIYQNPTVLGTMEEPLDGFTKATMGPKDILKII